MNIQDKNEQEDRFLEITDSILTVDLPLSVVKAYATRPDNSILAQACRVALGDEPIIKDNKKIT